MRTIDSFYIYKKKNMICIGLYDFNKYLVFKKVLIMNILERMFRCNKNLIIIITLRFSLQSIFVS